MRAIDTNILVRFLVGDDKSQTEKVYKLFKKTESTNGTLFVPFLVVIELVWVLESVYDIPRTAIIESISDLILMPILKFEQQSSLQQFTHLTKTNKFDLSDLLIGYSAKQQGCENVITLDRKASKSNLFELLK